jgi:hypothetical protein
VTGPPDQHPEPALDPDVDRAWPMVRALAAYGLSGRPLPDPPRDRFAWEQVVRLAEQQRVLGLVVAAVEAGDLLVDTEPRRVLADTHEAWCAHDLRLERTLRRAADGLDAAAIPFVVMKGAALAHRWYPDPAQRIYADIDLVVPGEHLRSATRVLAGELGAAASQAELRPGFDERFGKETLLRTASTSRQPGGLEIDVHRMPIAGALGLAIPLDELFAHRGEVLVAGRALPTTGPVPTILLACYQATVADLPPRLAAARDLVQLLAAFEADADEVIATAGRWQATAVLAAAVRESWMALDLPRSSAGPVADRLLRWADAARPTRRERLLLNAHRRPGHVYWRQLAGVLVIHGGAARARYLLALAFPQSEYRADRRWSVADNARRAWRAVTGPARHRIVAWGRRRRGRRLPPPSPD